MTVNPSDGFSRLEFKRSMLPFQLVTVAASLAIPSIVIKGAKAIAPGSFSAHPGVVLPVWCLLAAGCLFLFSRLRARADCEKPVVIVDPEGTTITNFVTKTWSWASISKMKYHESGQLKENKSVVFHLVSGGSEAINLRPMAGTTGRQLFETMRAYHRKFGPKPDPATSGSRYDSA